MKPFQEVVDKFHSLAPADFDRSLVGVSCSPFATDGELTFLLREKQARLLLHGVHFWGTRQSMMCRQFYRPPSYEGREDWFVDYFDVLSDSPFLNAFLNHQLGFAGEVMLYDSEDKSSGTQTKNRTVHVALCCGGGWLDVICESITLIVVGDEQA